MTSGIKPAIFRLVSYATAWPWFPKILRGNRGLLAACFLYCSTLNAQALPSSETSLNFYRNIRCHCQTFVSLSRSNRLVFCMKTKCVSCEVGTQYLCNIQTNYMLESVKGTQLLIVQFECYLDNL
jgi:hypothetical protein